MARYAEVKNGICVNLIEAEAAEAQAHDNWILIADGDEVGFGSSYDEVTKTWTRADLATEMGLSNEKIIALAKRELVDTDWTQLPDVGLTTGNVSEWRTYRDAIRKIKDGVVSYENWPEAPSKEYV